MYMYTYIICVYIIINKYINYFKKNSYYNDSRLVSDPRLSGMGPLILSFTKTLFHIIK